MAHVIPLRNIWLLFLYAADLIEFKGRFDHDVEEARDLPEMLARILSRVVNERMKRNLSRGYQSQAEVLSRVRGRIDMLKTVSHQLMERGQVACRFDEHWFNTPRNRLVRAALIRLTYRVQSQEVSHRCRQLAGEFGRYGVDDKRPSRAELAQDQIGRNDMHDHLMVALARMVFDVVIPTQEAGHVSGTVPDVSDYLVRKLFQRAVTKVLELELRPSGWQINSGRRLNWPVVNASDGLKAILPGMETDIELTNHTTQQRIVIDTKFTHLLTTSRYGRDVLKSGYLYQLYTYLRSQEVMSDPLSLSAHGMLLHPQVDGVYDEWVEIQGHVMRFKTIDLSQDSVGFESALRNIVQVVVAR